MHIKHKDASVFYTDQGSGPAIVLLHGFLENKEMWGSMIPHLAATHRVICIDLLGHGKSDCLGYVHTMEIFAEAIFTVVTHLKLRAITIIGHSMGGYVGLAFAKAYPENLKALCLLNSTPQVDNEERKQLRTRANQMAKKQYNPLVRMSVANLFDPTLKMKFEREIDETIDDALKTPLQGYIAANSGMSKRADNVNFWKTATFKKGLILGKNDWIIDAEKHKVKFESNTKLFSVLDGGHMMHITNFNDTLSQITIFLND